MIKNEIPVRRDMWSFDSMKFLLDMICELSDAQIIRKRTSWVRNLPTSQITWYHEMEKLYMT